MEEINYQRINSRALPWTKRHECPCQKAYQLHKTVAERSLKQKNIAIKFQDIDKKEKILKPS